MDFDKFEKFLSPEMKGMFNDMSTKLANVDIEGDAGGIGGLIEAASKLMKDEPDILKNSIETMKGAFTGNSEATEGLESLNMPGMIQHFMKTFMGGSDGQEDEQQKKIKEKKYTEKHITIAVTEKELENEQVKKFRIKIHPDDKEKQIFELKLEKETYAYQFWDKHVVTGEDILIRVGVEEIVKDILK